MQMEVGMSERVMQMEVRMGERVMHMDMGRAAGDGRAMGGRRTSLSRSLSSSSVYL